MKVERKKVIYIAGKYRDKHEWNVVQNIRKAEALAIKVWKKGMVALCPHKNTSLMGGACLDNVWMDGDLELLRRCDAVLLVDNWKESPGAGDEVTFAMMLGIPIFASFDELDVWDNGTNQIKMWEKSNESK